MMGLITRFMLKNEQCEYTKDSFVSDDTNGAGCNYPKRRDITYIQEIPYDGVFYSLKVSFMAAGHTNYTLTDKTLFYKKRKDAKKVFNIVKKSLVSEMDKRQILISSGR